MLTYATLAQFKEAKEIGYGGVVTPPAGEEAKIQSYLERATRDIQRKTRRDFFPWYEIRKFPIPYRFQDLRMRTFSATNLKLDNDLLEASRVYNGVENLTEGTDYFLLESNIYPKTSIAVRFPKYWGGFAGITPWRHYDQPIIEVEGFWGYHDEYGIPNRAWINTLDHVRNNNGMAVTDTTIYVLSATGLDSNGQTRFEVGMLLRVEDELMEITAVAESSTPVNSFSDGFSLGFQNPTATVTVIRGIRGTTAVAHAAGTVIYRWRVLEDISEIALQIARILRDSDSAGGGRLGVSDVSADAEAGIPGDPLSNIKMYIRHIW